jgi:hypothetical protein
MPRKRKDAPEPAMPRGYIKSSVDILLDQTLKHPAYRLYNLILAYWQQHSGCDRTNADLGALLGGLSREYVRRLLEDLKQRDLVAESATLDGRRQLVPARAIDLAIDALPVSSIFQPVDATFPHRPQPNPAGRASSGSCTPHQNIPGRVNYSCTPASTIVDAPLHEEEESNINTLDSSSSSYTALPSTIVDGKGQLSTQVDGKRKPSTIVDPPADVDFAAAAAKYCLYFGDIDAAVGDLIGDYLDDQELTTIAAAAKERPIDWVLAAIQETGLNKAANPSTYFRTVMTDWIGRKSRERRKKANGRSNSRNGRAHKPDGSELAAGKDSGFESEIEKLEHQHGLAPGSGTFDERLNRIEQHLINSPGLSPA